MPTFQRARDDLTSETLGPCAVEDMRDPTGQAEWRLRQTVRERATPPRALQPLAGVWAVAAERETP
jgi:hypothetical protein